MYTSMFNFTRDSTLKKSFWSNVFQTFPHKILLLGIKYSIRGLFGKLLTCHMRPCMIWTLPLQPSFRPTSHTFFSCITEATLHFSALGPSSSCCFFLLPSSRLVSKATSYSKIFPNPPMCFYNPPCLPLSLQLLHCYWI